MFLGKSALHWAAAVNNVGATLVLLKNGANRDMQDNKVSSCSPTNENHCSLVCVLIIILNMLQRRIVHYCYLLEKAEAPTDQILGQSIVSLSADFFFSLANI